MGADSIKTMTELVCNGFYCRARRLEMRIYPSTPVGNANAARSLRRSFTTVFIFKLTQHAHRKAEHVPTFKRLSLISRQNFLIDSSFFARQL